eukprot:TRINITY_DN3405_c0_g1_i4.p1 TRINITY_DN3405_c0_g1~~TRINITY_DN3405_c0_g1_i4.p1  ORF type:complete len:109 (+),score=1.49 TRINITY_DN3405_c0_g1_i4:347-673(+)
MMITSAVDRTPAMVSTERDIDCFAFPHVLPRGIHYLGCPITEYIHARANSTRPQFANVDYLFWLALEPSNAQRLLDPLVRPPRTRPFPAIPGFQNVVRLFQPQHDADQ